MAIGEIDLTLPAINVELFLAKPSREIVGKLSEAYNKKMSLKLGNINEITFTLPYEVSKNRKLIRNPNIDMIKERYLIKAVFAGKSEWYKITSLVNTMNEGDSMDVTCYLLPYELSDKSIRIFEESALNIYQVMNGGTIVDPDSGTSYVIDGILSETLWTLGYVDADISSKYRGYSFNSMTVLDCVFNIAETLNALIVWNTISKTISFYNADNYGINRGFTIHYGHYLKSLSRESKSDEMVTRLKVFGKDGMSIQSLNINGQNYLEDYSYFLYPFQRDSNHNVIKHSDFMSDSLCHAILDYTEYAESKQSQFATLLSQKTPYETSLNTRKTELSTLVEEMAVINNNIDIYKSMGYDYTSLTAQKTIKQTQINNKNAEISSINASLTSIDNQITTLKNSLKYSVFFTPQNLIELNDYIIYRDFTDESYIDEKVLYDDAKKQFEKYKEPQVILNMDIVNFLNIVEAQRDWDKLNLGDIVTIRYGKLNLNMEAKIIEITIDFESDNISLTIANTKDLMTDEEKLVKMIYSNNSSSTLLDMKSTKWDGIEATTSKVNQIIDNTWSTIKTGIEGGVNNTISINERGILVKNTTDPNNYLIIQNGVMAITNDNGNTWKHAITANGIVGERIYGKLLAGSNLVIDASDALGVKTFTVDGSGVTIAGSKLIITSGLPESQINATSVATWNTASTNASNAWNKFSGAGNTLPSGNVEFNFAGSTSKGGNAINTNNVGTQSATAVQNSTVNFNNRNDRKSTTPANPVILTDGTSIDHTVSTDGSSNISFEWTYNGTGDAYDIDGFIIYVRQSTSNASYTFGTNLSEEQVYYVTPEKRAFIVYGVPTNQYYTFGVQAYREVDNDIATTGLLKSSIIKPSMSGENPYQPSSTVAFLGDITGTVNGISASTVSSVATNFNNRNDRKSTTPATPVVPTDGTSVDHVINTDGSSDISFEWTYNGSGDAYDIDGFIVYIYSSASSSSYTFGTNVANEQVFNLTPEKRAFILYGVPANSFYTFGVKAYRMVDNDIAAGGIIYSTLAKATGSGENPYQPSVNVAFSGNVIGTINGTNSSVVSTATLNFNGRNDRNATTPANATILGDGTAIDHTINTDGSADVSFEWNFTGTGNAYDIDGFILYIYQGTTNSAYTFGSNVANEQVYYVTPEKRAFILYGVPANKYYTFGIQAYRIVDNDIVAGGVIKSNVIAKSTASGENPYQPSSTVAFAGNITGTIDGTSASSVASSANNSVQKGTAYNGVVIDSTSGLVITKSDGTIRTTLNATDGFSFEKKNGSSWDKKLYYNASTGNLVLDGELNAKSIKINGVELIAGNKLDGDMIDSIKVQQLDASTAKIGAAMIEDLYVGRNVYMAPEATISWTQVSNQPYIPTVPSYITSTKITSTSIESPNIAGGTIVIGSGNSVWKADANGIYLGNSTFASAPFRVSMSGALSATSATITGTITSSTISGSTVTGSTIRTADSGTRVVMNSYLADINMYHGANNLFQIRDDVTTTTICSPSNSGINIVGAIYASGLWDFSQANVTGVTAVFG